MVHYRIYFTDESGHVFEGHDCEAVDDLSAFNKAETFVKTHNVEIWQGSRCVAKIAKGGAAISVDSSTPPPDHAN